MTTLAQHHAFAIIGPSVWNNLPSSICSKILVGVPPSSHHCFGVPPSSHHCFGIPTSSHHCFWVPTSSHHCFGGPTLIPPLLKDFLVSSKLEQSIFSQQAVRKEALYKPSDNTNSMQN